MDALNKHLETSAFSKGGKGFVLGDRITYADLVIYQIAHDELKDGGWEGLKDYPSLKKLVDAVEARPNVKAFLKSDRYLGWYCELRVSPACTFSPAIKLLEKQIS
jgi:glutathione S-transferase